MTGKLPRAGLAAGAVAAGATLVTASAVTRFGIFEAGRDSARDPKYTVQPQRERIGLRDTG